MKNNSEWKTKKIKDREWSAIKGELAVDVYQIDKELIVRSAIAGVKHEDLDISVENDVLIINGSRVAPPEEKDSVFFLKECYWGDFSRRIIITDEIDPSRIEAVIKEGILTIRIPRIIREPKKPIKVKEL